MRRVHELATIFSWQPRGGKRKEGEGERGKDPKPHEKGEEGREGGGGGRIGCG